MPAARSRETAVVNCRPVGGHPGQEAALAGRLHAVATEPLQHLGVRADPGQPGRDDRGGQAGVAGQRRRHGQDGGDAAAAGGLDDAVDGEVGLASPAPGRAAPRRRPAGRAGPTRSASECTATDFTPSRVQARDHRAGGRPAAGHEHALDTQLRHGCPLLRSPVRRPPTLCGNRSAP